MKRPDPKQIKRGWETNLSHLAKLEKYADELERKNKSLRSILKRLRQRKLLVSGYTSERSIERYSKDSVPLPIYKYKVGKKLVHVEVIPKQGGPQ